MKILQILPYPIAEPIHGGQIRAKAIREHLIANNHQVISTSIYDPYCGYVSDKEDIAFNIDNLPYDIHHPKVMDFIIGHLAINSPTILSHLKQLIETYNINLIIVEQLWFLDIAIALSELYNLKIVYSSHNIEYKLKYSMLNDLEKNDPQYLFYIDEIKKLEEKALLNSKLIICCTESDKVFYESILQASGLTTPVVKAGNAVNPLITDFAQIHYWQNYIKRPYAVFVGSAHEPNSTGFWQMLAPGLTFLAPDEEIVVVGGVCDILLSSTTKNSFDDLNKSRLHLMGKRDVKELHSMILASHLIILPICEGEGSNLKTAEALESGRPIVSTSKAFRGYEDAMSLPHIYIEDTSSGFRQKIRTLLDSDRYTEGTPLDIRSKYYWSSQLKDINNYVQVI